MKHLTKKELDKLTLKELTKHLLDCLNLKDGDTDTDYFDELSIYYDIRKKRRTIKAYNKTIKTYENELNSFDGDIITDKINVLEYYRLLYKLQNIVRVMGGSAIVELILDNDKKNSKNIYKLF